MAEDFQCNVSSRYSSILSLSYSSSSFDMIESSDLASCVESDLEEGSENIVVPYQYEPEENGSESESSDESQNASKYCVMLYIYIDTIYLCNCGHCCSISV